MCLNVISMLNDSLEGTVGWKLEGETRPARGLFVINDSVKEIIWPFTASHAEMVNADSSVQCPSTTVMTADLTPHSA